MWEADEKLPEELAQVRKSLDAQLQKRNPHPRRPRLRKIKLWEEIVRDFAVTSPAHQKPAKRTPRRVWTDPWTDPLQEVDAYSETGITSESIRRILV
jgi:hypothetical protein